MDKAFDALVGQGVAGAMLVLLVLAIAYLQRRRDSDSESRLKDSREALTTQAETNRILGSLREAVAGLTQTMNGLTSTVQTMHAEGKASLDFQRTRDDRVERSIDANSGFIRTIEGFVRDNNEMLQRVAKALDDLDKRGR